MEKTLFTVERLGWPRNWTVVAHNKTSITFMSEDLAYEEYSGRVINYAAFSVTGATTLKCPSLTSRLVPIPIHGPTLIMLTTHPY